MVGLSVLAFGVAGAQPPELSISSGEGDVVEVAVVGGAVEDGWVLQDSYNGVDWRDLEEMDGATGGFSSASVPTTKRFFRAAQKPLATWQEALTQARERWDAMDLVKYQYRHRTSGAFFVADDLILVDDGEVKESTSRWW